MTALSLTPQQISVALENKDGELRLDSRIVADGFGMKSHKSYRYDVLEKYESKLAELGAVLFCPLETGEIVWFLNQDQVNFAGTLARNTDKAVAFKLNLVKAFSIAKQIIPVQNDRIRELELENENLRLRKGEADRQDFRLTAYGLATTLLLEGKSDAVVEIEKPTIEIIDNRNNTVYKGQTLAQLKDHINSKYGTKHKSGADIARLLVRKGMGHLIAQTPRSILSDYIPSENYQLAMNAIIGSDRQILLGE